ncbi:hypothetical protein EG327_001891 [Venturia inaequalis]|uniref:Uncharacterized protein n=1 Tax=Venturia inaequalis TaxID=5025 RepID=A0A8H3VNL4_VENIN|nr:hypothetical protein EG327_001891 [Venturia inaequalis]
MDLSPDDDHDGNEYMENALLWKKSLLDLDAREQRETPCGRHRLEQEPIPRNENQLRGIQLQEENPPVKPYTCDLLCAICYDQFFPASQVVDDNDASNTTRNLVDCIRSDLSYLRNSLKQHADLVVSRWKKKSKAKRLALLQELADLAPFRWASVHFMNMHNPRCDCRQGKIKVRSQKYDRLVGTYQDTWLTPYLDQDTLSEDPLRLLSLLHVRSAFQPEEWVMFDKWHVTLAEYHIVLIPEFNENCVVMEGPDYGKLVPWEEEKAHSWQIVGYCKARQILTAQKRIMHFLRKMLDALVGDQPFVDEPRVQSKWLQLVESSFFSFGISASISNSAYLLQPFSSPPTFDPVRILGIIRDRYRVALDELYQVQTDPRYVQHLAEALQTSTYFKCFDKRSSWRLCYTEIVSNTIQSVWRWGDTLYDCLSLVKCHDTWLASPSQENFDKLQEQMFRLWQMCAQGIAHTACRIDISLPYQRGFEHNFRIDKCGGSTQAHGHANWNDSFGKDNLFWSLSCLGHDEFRRLYTQDPCFNLQVLDHVLSKADFKENNRISDRLLQKISDIAVLDEVRMAIGFDRRYDCRPGSLSDVRPYDLLHSHLCERWRTEEPSLLCGPILESLCTTHRFPVGKLDNVWLDRASAARDELNRLWQVIRTETRRQLENLKAPESFIDRQCKLMSAGHCKDYVEERQMEEFAVHRALEETAELRAEMNFHVTTTPGQTIWGSEESDSNFPQNRKRTVAKLAKPAIAVEDHDTEPSKVSTFAVQPDPEDQPLSIQVDKSNYALFSDMFPAPGEVTKRSFKWVHFVSAMIDANFNAEQGSGSAVRFSGERGSISFHKPHPAPVIDPIMLQSMGKRMKKWFSWSRDVFEVRV